GRSIGFFADKRLKGVEASGGTILTICDAERGVGGTWSPDGTIVFAPVPTTFLYKVPAGGGKPVPVTKLDAARHETAHRYPRFLPDGKHFLYMAANPGGAPDDPANAIRLGSLDGSGGKVARPTVPNPAYAAGHLLSAGEGTLFAHRFDAPRLQTVGEPVPIVPRVQLMNWQSYSSFSVSDAGILVTSPVYAPATRLVWLDRSGRETGVVGELAPFGFHRLSPDGKKVVADIYDPVRDTSDIWIYDAASGAGTKFIFGQGHETSAVWSPDGGRIVFSSDGRAKSVRWDMYVKPLDGSKEEPLAPSEDVRNPEDWTSDGRFVSFNAVPLRGKRNNQVWVLDMAEKKASAFAAEANVQSDSRFSPDGRWIAYTSNESGQSEVYVRSFPTGAKTLQVSKAGGALPVWRRDGKELFYLALDFKTRAVPTPDEGGIHIGAPAALFTIRPGGGNVYDVSADGQRFLVDTLASEPQSPPMDLYVNWTALLKKN